MITVIFLVLGLIIGSFLNVVIYRLDMAETLMGRSHCRHCKTQISWYDNIPFFSFLLLRARCRKCEKKISWQYPIVEAATGIVFAIIAWKFFVLLDTQSWFLTGYYLIAFSALIVIFVYDLLHMEIPMVVLWSGIFFAILCNLILDWNLLQANILLDSHTYAGTLGAFIAFVFFYLLSTFSHEKWMGMGDVFLVILLGLIVGWPKIILALFLAFFIGAIYGIVLIVLKLKKLNSQVPFAPFLIGGTFIALLWFEGITTWYFKLF
jgi:prepilin signal peptidase PulO-like enzyme (type II secretory pathway)